MKFMLRRVAVRDYTEEAEDFRSENGRYPTEQELVDMLGDSFDESLFETLEEAGIEAVIEDDERPGPGEFKPPGTLILRVGVGTAELGDAKYEMSGNPSDMSPIIRSGQTGRWFLLSWEDIVSIAIDRGIDQPEDSPVMISDWRPRIQVPVSGLRERKRERSPEDEAETQVRPAIFDPENYPEDSNPRGAKRRKNQSEK